jgi:crescentin
MSKLGGFFARKAALYDRLDEPAPANSAPGANIALMANGAASANSNALDNPLELDEELFTALGAQMGSENELLRNLLLEANAKIGEIDTIKSAVGKLINPVSKALTAFETEKSERIGLQTVLNNTRTAYGKLRNEAAEFEKKSAAYEKECHALRQELSTTQALLRTTEATKAEIAIDIAARKAQIAVLDSRLTQECGETKMLREENRRLDERLTTTDKRIIAIEADLNATRQRLRMAEDEKNAQQASFERASAEAAKLSRKLAEAETSLNNAHARLRHVEGNFAEVNTERTRLAGALDEANERHNHELATHRMRFDTLQARASATEKLLGEAREHLVARAEEIREYDRHTADLALERDALQARVAELEAERYTRETQFQEIDQARSTLMERSTSLARAFTSKETTLARAEESIVSLNERVGELEAALASDRHAAEQTIDELNSLLRREKLERAVVEGALESGRKDFSRLMREVMALQRGQTAADDPATLRPANAA